MRIAIFIIVVSLATSIAGAAFAADEMTEDKCVKEFLEKPVKDWKGYDNCRRGATQLKIKGADGLANRSLMLPQTNAPPNANGAGISGNANVR